MTPWRFVKAFGGNLPGGGVADVDQDSTAALDMDARWTQAGGMEVNCLACHNGSADQDMSEYAAQVGDANLKWAATAASGLALVEGSVKTLPRLVRPGAGPAAGRPRRHGAAGFLPPGLLRPDQQGLPEHQGEAGCQPLLLLPLLRA